MLNLQAIGQAAPDFLQLRIHRGVEIAALGFEDHVAGAESRVGHQLNAPVRTGFFDQRRGSGRFAPDGLGRG